MISEVGEFNKLISVVKQYSYYETDYQVKESKRAVLDTVLYTFSLLERLEEKEDYKQELEKTAMVCCLNLAGISNYLGVRLKVDTPLLEAPILIEDDGCQTVFNLCDLVLSISIEDRYTSIEENSISIYNFLYNYIQVVSVYSNITFEKVNSLLTISKEN